MPSNIRFAAKDKYEKEDIEQLNSGEQLLKYQQTYRELLVLNTSIDLNGAKIIEFSEWTGIGGWIPNRKERRRLIGGEGD